MQSFQKVLGGREKVKVAIVQTGSYFLNKEKTIDLACAKIAEAAAKGAELIVFPEAWITGYPYWGEGWETDMNSWVDVRVKFYDNAIIIPSEDTDRLSAAAAKANAHVVIGCNEMDPRHGVHTIYNSILFINRSGKIMGTHRKVMPTFVERAVWGGGDGSSLVTYQTDIGRIGGLICSEHTMTLVRARLISQGEDIHIALYPGAFDLHTGPKLEEFAEKPELFIGNFLTRAHGIEAGAFVMTAVGYISEERIPEDFALKNTLNIDYVKGGSSISAPDAYIVPPTGGDTILYATLEANRIKCWKAIIDTAGHYSRPDIVNLNYNYNPHQLHRPFQPLVEAVESAPRYEVERIAEKYEVGLDEVEKATQAISKKQSKLS
jgi:nitrilase